MVVVAVAGGTGHLGLTIVEALIATEEHSIKILSRKPNSELSIKLDVSVIAVDYSDLASLTKTLDDFHVHTVISALTNYDDAEGNVPPEIELIQAADASTTTKRMISSVWSANYNLKHVGQTSSTKNIFNARAALKSTRNLEYTVFYNGYFTDYWGMPILPSHMPNITMVLDIPNNAAAIPGSGNVPVVFTHTRDVAKFVAASLDLNTWEPETYVIGDRMTFNELLALAQEVKGAKFKVVYDSIEMMESGEVSELPGQVPLYSFIPKAFMQYLLSAHGLWFEEGVYDFNPVHFLNEKFPQIKPISVKEILDRAWKKA